jgi:hypothetical protein
MSAHVSAHTEASQTLKRSAQPQDNAARKQAFLWAHLAGNHIRSENAECIIVLGRVTEAIAETGLSVAVDECSKHGLTYEF